MQSGTKLAESLLLTRQVAVLVLQYFCFSYVWYFYITWLPTYLREGRMDNRPSARPRYAVFASAFRRIRIAGRRDLVATPLRGVQLPVGGFVATAVAADCIHAHPAGRCRRWW